MIPKEDKTTIQISKELREKLVKRKRGDDTYTDVIEKTLIASNVDDKLV